MSYAESGTIGGTGPRHFERYEKLDDAVIGAAIDAVAEHGANAVEVRRWGGAMARPTAGAGPIGHRQVPFSITVDGPAEAAAPIARHATGGSFLNFLKDPSRTHAAYEPDDHTRLRQLKRAYDPDAVFSHGHAIAPLAEERLELAS